MGKKKQHYVLCYILKKHHVLHFHLLVVTIRFTPKSLSKFQLCDWSSLSWKPHFLIGLSKKETLGGEMSSPGVVQT